jgi:hypothetical protein
MGLHAPLRRAILATSVGLGLAAVTTSPQAALLANYTGWTEMNECWVCDSTVSFAVWQTEGSSWATEGPFAELDKSRLDQSGEPDFSARYVYLYQVVNTNYNDPSGSPFPEGDLGRFQVLSRSNDASLFTSGGYLGAVFDDSGAGGPGAVGGSGNVTLASPDFGGAATPTDDSAPDSLASVERNGGAHNRFQPPGSPEPIDQGPDAPSDGVPSSQGIVGVSLFGRDPVELSGLAVPDDLDLFASPAPGILGAYGRVASFVWDAGDFGPGESSPVLFLTSNLGPAYDFGSTQSYGGPFADGDGGTLFPGAAGDVPTPTPVPAALPLLGSALLGVAALSRRTRRRGR